MTVLMVICIGVLTVFLVRANRNTENGVAMVPLPRNGFAYFYNGYRLYLVKKFFVFRAYLLDDEQTKEPLPEDFFGRRYIRTNSRTAADTELFLETFGDKFL